MLLKIFCIIWGQTSSVLRVGKFRNMENTFMWKSVSTWNVAVRRFASRLHVENMSLSVVFRFQLLRCHDVIQKYVTIIEYGLYEQLIVIYTLDCSVYRHLHMSVKVCAKFFDRLLWYWEFSMFSTTLVLPWELKSLAIPGFSSRVGGYLSIRFVKGRYSCSRKSGLTVPNKAVHLLVDLNR